MHSHSLGYRRELFSTVLNYYIQLGSVIVSRDADASRELRFVRSFFSYMGDERQRVYSLEAFKRFRLEFKKYAYHYYEVLTVEDFDKFVDKFMEFLSDCFKVSVKEEVGYAPRKVKYQLKKEVSK